MAAISLYIEGKIDQLDYLQKPYDVLAHQIISLLLEYSGLPLARFHNLNQEFISWSNITNEEYESLAQHLIQGEYIEILEQEVITGIATEDLLKGSEFFAHFISENNFSVHNENKKIGELPLTPSVVIGINIFLAAQIWKIINIDMHGQKIYVTKAIDGNPPLFLGGSAHTSHEIRREMKSIIFDSQ